MKLYLGRIPFDEDGNQLPYGYLGVPIDWRPNGIFEDTLRYDDYHKGWSSITYRFRNDIDKHVTMFASDFHLVVPHMVRGVIKGKFTYRKHGSSFGIGLIQEPDA